MKKIILIPLIIIISSFGLFAQSIVIGFGASIYVPSGTDICAVVYGNISGNIYGEGTQCSNSPVPVELNLFTAKVNGMEILLEWKTETEINNYGFEVQRAIINNKSLNWENIGFVKGFGNSNSQKQYLFIDKDPFGGTKFHYRLKQVDADGEFDYSNIVEVQFTPDDFILYQNYPNPFNGMTTIKYTLPIECKVNIEVYNAVGMKVADLLNVTQAAGYQKVVWDANNVASGVYLYTIQAVTLNEEESFVNVKKMILIQ